MFLLLALLSCEFLCLQKSLIVSRKSLFSYVCGAEMIFLWQHLMQDTEFNWKYSGGCFEWAAILENDSQRLKMLRRLNGSPLFVVQSVATIQSH